MKNAAFVMSAVLVLLTGSQNLLSAQKTATWEGGTPGNSNAWNCPSNWKEGCVPNEFSDVIIANDPGHSILWTPVINNDAAQINSLTITAGSSLDIGKNGCLEVLSNSEISPGAHIFLKGALRLPAESEHSSGLAAIDAVAGIRR